MSSHIFVVRQFYISSLSSCFGSDMAPTLGGSLIEFPPSIMTLYDILVDSCVRGSWKQREESSYIFSKSLHGYGKWFFSIPWKSEVKMIHHQVKSTPHTLPSHVCGHTNSPSQNLVMGYHACFFLGRSALGRHALMLSSMFQTFFLLLYFPHPITTCTINRPC